MLASCEYFTVRRYALDGSITLTAGEDSFVSVLVIDSDGAVMTYDGEKYQLGKGESWFIPAGTGEIKVNGRAGLIVSEIN